MKILSAAVITTLLSSSAFFGVHAALSDQAYDPGIRPGIKGAGAPLGDLRDYQKKLFDAGLEAFKEQDTVSKNGLGPRMNLDSCSGCHARPNIGGSSPDGISENEHNPQFIFFNKQRTASKPNITDVLPPFITETGPVREARFIKSRDPRNLGPDGGVHSLFTISGLEGAEGCKIKQPNFADELSHKNVIFSIPTPVFGAGLIEQIPDQAIIDNLQPKNDKQMEKKRGGYGIKGRLNIVNAGHSVTARANPNGNDGTIARFGWKAQNKSLLVFSGEAYNVEMGITNELFQTERYEAPNCQNSPTPNDISNPEKAGLDVLSDIEKFAAFMRFLAPPIPSKDTPGGSESIAKGSALFSDVGCSLCHTPSFKTGKSKVEALSEKDVNLYSDIALHDMGKGLEDGVSQGQANGREFRTAPLWGLGQRAWFLHDGRTNNLVTNNLVEAIKQHRGPGSEANTVVKKFEQLPGDKKQDLLNFLRSL